MSDMFFGRKKTVSQANFEAIIPILVRVSDFIDSTSLSKNELINCTDRQMIKRFHCLQSYLRGTIDALAMCVLSNAEVIKLREHENLGLSDKNRRIHTDAVSKLKDIIIPSKFYKGYFYEYSHRDNPLVDSYKHSHVEFDSSAVKYPDFMALGIDHIISPVSEVLRDMDCELDMMGGVLPLLNYKMVSYSDRYEREISVLLKKAKA